MHIDPNSMIAVLFIGLWMFVMICVGVRVLRTRLAKEKTVKAVVLDKQKVDVFSKYAGNGSRQKYIIIFLAEGKRLSFYVSEYSYGGYRIDETGILRYKGHRLIDFDQRPIDRSPLE